MNDLQKQHELWDQFLKDWPISRLENMKLDEYTRAGYQDTFTYWLESKLDKMGSIWGGSSFKFGIYSRRDRSEKSSDNARMYSDTHAWYAMHGSSAEEAFENVRNHVVSVANLAKKGDLDSIQSIDQLGEKFMWKIAFHYQDRNNPLITNVFTKSNLAKYARESDSQSMAELQKAVLNKKPENMDILEYGELVWEKSNQDTKLEIWKLSHGGDLSEDEREQLLRDQFAVMYGKTGIGQGDNFVENTKVGTLFYLCHGNSSQLIGQFTTNATPYGEDGWMKRSYRVLMHAVNSDSFTAHSKKWSPRGNSTFWKVPESELLEFEEGLLKHYFEIDLAKLIEIAKTPIEECKPFEDCINCIYYGPPGTGKTYKLIKLLKEKYGYQSKERPRDRYSFVTFHQSYGYEEFVEGLRPRLETKENSETDNIENEIGKVYYEIRSGVFKKLCDSARNSQQRFAMVIDEINRGNISKIFGELITLIEPDKREGGENAISVTLPYSGEKFSIPSNVDIFGTMNTADRSLTTLDTALRRRFKFLPLRPDSNDGEGRPLAGLRVDMGAQSINIPEMLTMINQRIETLYDREHCVGHAYFMPLHEVKDGEARLSALAEIFKSKVLPLLEEYFFEDWEKIRLVLADNQKSQEFQFITVGESAGNHEEKLQKIFGDADIDAYATKKIYRIQESAVNLPEAYIGIYGKV